MNSSLSKIVVQRIKFLENHKDEFIIDADTHISSIEELSPADRNNYLNNPNYYHGKPICAEDLLREMKMAGIDMSLIWQNPAVTHYGTDKEINYQALHKANLYIFQSAEKYPEKFIPAGWTDPKALGTDLAISLVEKCIKELGFLVVKMNPAQNQYNIDSESVITVFNKIVELGGIPAFHFGGDTIFTNAEGFEKLALLHPEHPVLGIHMGGGGPSYNEGEIHYINARELGLRRQNIYFIESAKRDTHIESDLITYQLAGKPYCDHIFCGSDAPYGRETWNFGGYRMMFDSLIDGMNHPDKRLQTNPDLFNRTSAQKYMGGNIAQFLIDGYKNMLITRTGKNSDSYQ
jgi:predicted TIM-barrel fold metal-dependent hydrolase